EAIVERLEEEFGGKTIFGIMWEGLQEMFSAPNNWGGAGQFLRGLSKFLSPGYYVSRAIFDAIVEWALEDLNIEAFESILFGLLREQINHIAMTIWASI